MPRRADTHSWADLPDTELLRLRFRDLRLRIEDSPLAADLDRVYSELERRGIRFRPHAWFSTEWFSPDGIPGIAVPFFLAHPRLRNLERRMMGDAEGGARKWRLRILRHEAGHALDTAFGLRRKARWRQLFGRASAPYPRDYLAKPGSKAFVLHLGHWYAQSHPTEDFAETFAVWLQPKARWRREYDGWPALEKLEYVDALMAEIAGKPARNRKRTIVAPLSGNRRTLGEHYRRRLPLDERFERRYDGWLEEAFEHGEASAARLAARQVSKLSPAFRRRLVRRTGGGRYLVDHTIEAVAQRVRYLNLSIAGRKRLREQRIEALLERIVLDVLRRNRERYVL